MYSVSQNFKTKIKDEDARKSCLIIFDDLWFDSGDLVSGDTGFSQYFNVSEDLSFGDCPSDTLSFSVIANGTLKGYPFGDAQTYLGVQTATDAFTMPTGYNGYISISSTVYSARDTGFYKGSAKLVDGKFFSVVSNGTYVWAHGEPGTYRHTIGTSTASRVSLITFMQSKLANGISAVFSSNTVIVWTDGAKDTYEYVPMGLYRVERPRSTVGDIISIQDAYDRMELFDKDGAEFLASLTYPKTLGQIYTALCTYVGVSYETSTFTNSTVSYSSSPFSDSACTLRDILSWIAEKARKVAHFNRTGVLGLKWVGSTQAEELTEDQVTEDGFSLAEYITQPVDSVILKVTNGSTLSFGTTQNNPYQITGNPFISTITSGELDEYKAIPTYVPVELGVFDVDPSIDLGDLIGTLGVSKKYIAFADAMGVALTDRYGVVYAEEADGAFSFPLMSRKINYMGAIHAIYSATGGKYREYDQENTKYNAMISINETQLEDAIDDYDESLTQTVVFNRLTDNGTAQGLFLDESTEQLYFNAGYINTGYLDADRIEANTITISKLTSDAQSVLVSNVTSKNQYYLSTSDSSATGGSWSDTVPTWESEKYIWVRVSTTKTFANNQSTTTTSDSVYDKALTTALSTASSAASEASTAQTTADGAVKATVSVYYRSTTSTTPTISTSMTIGTSDNTDNAWEYIIPQPKNGAYFFTCERYTYNDNTVGFSDVRQMSNLTASSLWCSTNDATKIDGGQLYANSVTANAISVSSLDAISASIAGWTIDSTRFYKEVTISGIKYMPYIQAPTSPTATNAAFAVMKTENGTNTWPFEVNYSGRLLATNAEITGNITATSGKIANFTISGNLFECITNNTSGTQYRTYVNGTSNIGSVASNGAFGIQHRASSSSLWENDFYVLANGKLYANNADITGTIKTSNGAAEINSSGQAIFKGTSGSALIRLVNSSNTNYFSNLSTAGLAIIGSNFHVAYGEGQIRMLDASSSAFAGNTRLDISATTMSLLFAENGKQRLALNTSGLFIYNSSETMLSSLAANGTLTISSTNGIAYKGTKATYNMIKFKDNTTDTYGNGIIIGGGGLVVIGGGEASDTIAADYSNGGAEELALGSDGNIVFWVNVQNGLSSGNKATMTSGGWNYYNSSGTLIQEQYFNQNSNTVRLVTSTNSSYDYGTVTGLGTYYRAFILICTRGTGSGAMGSTVIPLAMAKTSTSTSTESWCVSAQNSTYQAKCYFDFTNNRIYISRNNTNSDCRAEVWGLR